MSAVSHRTARSLSVSAGFAKDCRRVNAEAGIILRPARAFGADKGDDAGVSGDGWPGGRRGVKVNRMSEISGKTQAGTFHVDGAEIFGELTVDGTDSSLHLRNDALFNEQAISDRCILGTLHDLVKVSLFGCISSGAGHASRKDQRYYFAEVFPHHVISGHQHLRPTDETISAIHFVIDDSTTLFYDFDAFGKVLRPKDYIETIAQANREIIHRDVKMGPDPEIVYFAGRREIFKTDIAISTVSASHNPIASKQGSGGVSIKNTIPVAISFVTPVNFDSAFDGLLALVRYFELIVGRQQNVLDIGVVLGDGASYEQYLNVDYSMAPQRDVSKGERNPHPIDILLSPIDDPTIFGNVLSAYFGREPEWKTPRVRFTSKFNQRYSYDVDRLIATANIFDILPDSIFPPSPPVPNDMSEAREKAKVLFAALPRSSDRDSVLSALGRLGKLSLKRKIAARVKLISDKTAAFPELAMVTERAVNCRNYFVHGSQQDFIYSNNYPVVWFFVDTLQFVFGVSDLIEAGWNIAAWLARGTMMSHPFGQYKIEYSANLKRLKQALAGAT
jgi:hypothetical protein